MAAHPLDRSHRRAQPPRLSSRERRGAPRRDRERSRRAREDRKYAQKMAMAQQMPMRMAMMQGMMGVPHPAAMQMAMMQQMSMGGMGHPPFMPGMPIPPPPPHPMLVGPQARRSKRGGSSSSSRSCSNCSKSSSGKEGVLPPAAAMAAMAAMWPGASACAAGGPFGMGGPSGRPHMRPGNDMEDPGGNDEVEAFLSANPVSQDAGEKLRQLSASLQQAVMRRGPVSDTRNPSAVLVARIRDAELGRVSDAPASFAESFPLAGRAARSPPPIMSDDRKPARRSAKAAIETMIREFRLSPGCAWMLRALPPDKQKLAAQIDPSGHVDPSGYVAEQLKKIV